MNGGRAGDRALVPSDWIARMTELRHDVPQPSAPPWYGLHAWIPQAAGGRSMFWGVNGQNIFIDPVAKVVIVHLAIQNGPASMAIATCSRCATRSCGRWPRRTSRIDEMRPRRAVLRQPP